MKAIEITGSINEQGSVELDDAQEWSLAALKTSAIDLLNDPEEDIYTLEDGKPIDPMLQPIDRGC